MRDPERSDTGIIGSRTNTILFQFVKDMSVDKLRSRHIRRIKIEYGKAVACLLYTSGVSGCKTVCDIAPAYLSKENGEELRKHLL